MKRILRIGMDVHSTNYTLCAMEPIIGEDDRIFANIQVTPDYKNILMFIENLKMKLGLDNEYDIQCGYEAGCLGYSLYNQLTAAGVKCVILAPTTMLTPQGQRVKTDARDALMIAQCLSYGGYHAVYIPTGEDDSVKEYLRMRDDHKTALKRLSSRSMRCVCATGIITREQSGQSNMLHGCGSWNFRRYTGKRWMSIWHPMMNRRQRLSGLIKGSGNWHQGKVMKKRQRSWGASLESRPIQPCHCLWRPGISAGLQRGILMPPFLALRRERVPAVTR